MRPTAIALGSFDGLHQGHRRVIAAITGSAAPGSAAAGSGAAGAMEPPPVPTVVSFWPHPREVLHGELRLRLDLPEEKLDLLEPLGIRQLVLVPFDAELAALSPEAFVEEVLVGQLQARRIAVGDNFRFGAGRRGSAQDLETLAARHGVAVSVLPMLWDGAERVSSSRIRRALADGDIAEAERLLERPYRFRGRVVRGRGLGHQLGWPTANLQVDGRKFLPLEGVYAAWVWLAQDAGPGPDDQRPPTEPLPIVNQRQDGDPCPASQRLAAVMNLGPQPTIDPASPSTVEVHLLDRQLELVGRELVVQPIALLRRQQRFADRQALSRQIGRDAEQARLLCGVQVVG